MQISGPHSGSLYAITGTWCYVYVVLTLTLLQSYFADGKAIYPPYFGEGSGNVSMGNVMCEGGEENVLTCPHTKYPNCGHHEDAAVSCLVQGMNMKIYKNDPVVNIGNIWLES